MNIARGKMMLNLTHNFCAQKDLLHSKEIVDNIFSFKYFLKKISTITEEEAGEDEESDEEEYGDEEEDEEQGEDDYDDDDDDEG